jgi:hypothetical protein
MFARPLRAAAAVVSWLGASSLACDKGYGHEPLEPLDPVLPVMAAPDASPATDGPTRVDSAR